MMADKIKDLADRFFSLYDARLSGEGLAIFMYAATAVGIGLLGALIF